MKPFLVLAAAVLLAAPTAADARGLRIRLSAPRLPAAPAINPSQAVATAAARPRGSGTLIVLPGSGAGASAASAQPLLDPRSDRKQDWSSTPFAPRQQSAATLPAWQPPQPPAPKPEKAVFQCPPERNVGGFCLIN